MDKQTIDEIRRWVAAGKALDELATIPMTPEQVVAFAKRYDKWERLRDDMAETWLTELLDYYDANEASKQRTADIFGSAKGNSAPLADA